MHPSSPPSEVSLSRCELLARLDEAREYLEWSFVTLAEMTGVAKKSSWHRWFRGKEEISEYLVKRAVDVMAAELDVRRKILGDDENSLEKLLEIRDSLQQVPALWRNAQAEEGTTDQSDEESSPVRLLLQDERLVDAADRLGREVERQWILEADERRLRLPGPIPVQWRWARGVTSKVDVVANDPPRRTPVFSTLPGIDPVTSESLQAGGLRELFGVYAGVDSGRVVILGKYGTGKSASAILTLLEALTHRSSLDKTLRAAVPVPVLYTTHGWDPRSQSLREWLVARLASDYPFLRARHDGRDVATQLVDAGGVALFLDGFDEMDSSLYQDALTDIGKPTTFRLVLLTRSKEFAEAVSASRHVDAAAALELQPVSPEDAATYLENWQRDETPSPWDRLSTHLCEHPDSVLSRALDSPLNLTLLRDLDQPAAIDELLNTDRFNAPEEVENELLDRIISADPDRLVLGYIATQMNEQGNPRDLAWWQMHRWIDHWTALVARIAVTMLLGLLVGGIVGAIAFGPLGQYTVMGNTGTLFGTIYLSAMGAGFGLLTGLVSEFRQPRPTHRFIRNLLRSETFDPAVGLVVGIATGLAVGNQSYWAFGLLAGLLAAGVTGRAAANLQPESGETRHPSWRTVWSKLHIVSGVVTGLPIGLTYGLTKGPVHGLIAGIVTTFAFGLMVGFSRPSTDVATDPHLSWRHDRKRGISFGLTTGLAIGLPLGMKNGTAHGPLAGLITGVCFAIIVGLGCAIGASDTWRTTLLFLQLRRHGIPMLGMKFLESGRKRGMLRTVGPLYQFKHPSLQDRLSNMYQQHHRTPR